MLLFVCSSLKNNNPKRLHLICSRNKSKPTSSNFVEIAFNAVTLVSGRHLFSLNYHLFSSIFHLSVTQLRQDNLFRTSCTYILFKCSNLKYFILYVCMLYMLFVGFLFIPRYGCFPPSTFQGRMSRMWMKERFVAYFRGIC